MGVAIPTNIWVENQRAEKMADIFFWVKEKKKGHGVVEVYAPPRTPNTADCHPLPRPLRLAVT